MKWCTAHTHTHTIKHRRRASVCTRFMWPQFRWQTNDGVKFFADTRTKLIPHRQTFPSYSSGCENISEFIFWNRRARPGEREDGGENRSLEININWLKMALQPQKSIIQTQHTVGRSSATSILRNGQIIKWIEWNGNGMSERVRERIIKLMRSSATMLPQIIIFQSGKMLNNNSKWIISSIDLQRNHMHHDYDSHVGGVELSDDEVGGRQ